MGTLFQKGGIVKNTIWKLRITKCYMMIWNILNEYNWDDGFAYLDGFAETTELNEWKQFIYFLYNDILSNKYRKDRRSYEIPLTKVQKYKFRKKQIPEIFLTDL